MSHTSVLAGIFTSIILFFIKALQSTLTKVSGIINSIISFSLNAVLPTISTPEGITRFVSLFFENTPELSSLMFPEKLKLVILLFEKALLSIIVTVSGTAKTSISLFAKAPIPMLSKEFPKEILASLFLANPAPLIVFKFLGSVISVNKLSPKADIPIISTESGIITFTIPFLVKALSPISVIFCPSLFVIGNFTFLFSDNLIFPLSEKPSITLPLIIKSSTFQNSVSCFILFIITPSSNAFSQISLAFSVISTTLSLFPLKAPQSIFVIVLGSINFSILFSLNAALSILVIPSGISTCFILFL